MIRKPTAQAQQEDAFAANLRTATANLHAATTCGVAVLRAGSYYIRGLICWGFAILWGFAALTAGVFMQFPTFFGVGTLAIVMGWLGTRMFSKARGGRSPRPSHEVSRHDVEQPWVTRLTEALPTATIEPSPVSGTARSFGRRTTMAVG